MRKNKQESECASRLQVPDVMERVRPPSTAASGVAAHLRRHLALDERRGGLGRGILPNNDVAHSPGTRTTITTTFYHNNNNSNGLLLRSSHAEVQERHAKQLAAPQPPPRVHRVLCFPCCQHHCLHFAPCSSPPLSVDMCRSLTGTISGRSVGLCMHVIGEPFMRSGLCSVDCCCNNMAANLEHAGQARSGTTQQYKVAMSPTREGSSGGLITAKGLV
jgi:hypothetical protein